MKCILTVVLVIIAISFNTANACWTSGPDDDDKISFKEQNKGEENIQMPSPTLPSPTLPKPYNQ